MRQARRVLGLRRAEYTMIDGFLFTSWLVV